MMHSHCLTSNYYEEIDKTTKGNDYRHKITERKSKKYTVFCTF